MSMWSVYLYVIPFFMLWHFIVLYWNRGTGKRSSLLPQILLAIYFSSWWQLDFKYGGIQWNLCKYVWCSHEYRMIFNHLQIIVNTSVSSKPLCGGKGGVWKGKCGYAAGVVLGFFFKCLYVIKWDREYHTKM